MELKNFIQAHPNEKFLILGNGKSILNLPKKIDLITIGVNDIERHMIPTYLVLTDNPNRFGVVNSKRRNQVQSTKSKFVFVFDKWWTFKSDDGKNLDYKRIVMKLGKKGKLDNLDSKDTVDYSITSPYVAAILAYKMGAKEIGIIGVDFTDGHFYRPEDGVHPIVKSSRLEEVECHFKALTEELERRGIKVWNLSEESILKPIPKKSLSEFLCYQTT